MRENFTISIIIPVLHEAGEINVVIAHLRDLDPDGTVEIIVVDGDRGGSTINAIRDDRVIRAHSEKGRGPQMNRGAALASGDVLLFLHADTRLPPGAFSEIRKYLEDNRYVAGAFDLGIDTGRTIFRITERYVAIRTRMTKIPFGDQAIFIRRGYFEKIGGFKPVPIMEDVELMARIRKHGDAICIIPHKVMTSARRWEKEGVLHATFRNWTLQLLYLFGVPPEKLIRFYR
jgi:rSAM/selenodomain-associated transferase 2